MHNALLYSLGSALCGGQLQELYQMVGFVAFVPQSLS